MQTDATPGVSQSQLQAAAEAHFAAVSDKRAVAAAARTDAQAAEADSTAEAAASEVTAAQADLVDKALASETSATGNQAGQGRPTTGNTSSGVPHSKPTILSEDTGDRRAAAVNQASKASRSLRRGSTAAPEASASTAVVRRRAGPSEPVAAAGSGAAGVAVGMREAARAGLGRLAQRLQTAATLRPAQPVEALPGAQKSTGGRSGGLQRADLVVAMPSAHDRSAHLLASRTETGVPAHLLSEAEALSSLYISALASPQQVQHSCSPAHLLCVAGTSCKQAVQVECCMQHSSPQLSAEPSFFATKLHAFA